jgi:hypothetical protein
MQPIVSANVPASTGYGPAGKSGKALMFLLWESTQLPWLFPSFSYFLYHFDPFCT